MTPPSDSNASVGAQHAAPLQRRLSPMLLLAVLLMFGSEVLVWTNPPGRETIDWPLMLVGYLAVAAILLDLTVRYRVHDLFGVLLLSGVYSLTVSLTLNPESMLSDLPRTLVTRIMGAHALLAVEMIWLFLVLTGSQKRHILRLLLVGSVIVGFAWGIWARWFPDDVGYPSVSLVTMLVYGAVFVGILAALTAVLPAQTAPLTPDHLRLSRRGWALALLVLAALAAFRALDGNIPSSAVMALLVLALCLVIIWFRGRKRGQTLLDGHIPAAPPAWRWLIAAAGLFFGAAALGYSLPRIPSDEFNQLRLIGIGFTAYGLAWLPTVSLVLGVRAYLRQMQANR